MPLTDTQIRNLKPGQRPVKGNRKDEKSSPTGDSKDKAAGDRIRRKKEAPKFIATEKPYKVSDGGGLYLEVDPAGGKYWRFKYRFAGKEKRISLGVYDDVSLAEAREERDACRKQLAGRLADAPAETWRGSFNRARRPLYVQVHSEE